MAKKRGSSKSVDKKFNSVLTYLITSIILFVASVLLYYVSTNAFALDLFYLLGIVLGFVSVAFLIAFLAFVFLKYFKK